MRGGRGAWLLAAWIVATSLAPAPARADSDGAEPSWHFRRFQAYEYTLTANAYLATIAIGVYARSPDVPRWSGGILLDDAVRDALRVRSRTGRTIVARISDVLLFGALAYPVVIDSLLVAGLAHDDSDLALQMSLVSIEAFAVMRLLNDVTKLLVGRARPYNRECRRDPGYAGSCYGETRYQSFVSGHALATFTAAFLTCTQHAYLPLYGAPWDAFACGATLAGATATSVLRILSDNHYLSDVVAGAALGAVAGFVVPWLLHYRHDRLGADAASRGGLERVPSRPVLALPVLAFPWS